PSLVLAASASLVFVAAAQEAPRPPADDGAWTWGEPVPEGAVAVVDGLVVPIATFVDELARRQLRQDAPVGAEVLDNLIKETLVAAAAERAGVEATDEDVDREFAELEARLRERDAKLDLKALLREQGVDVEALRRKLRFTVMLKRLARLDQKLPADVRVEEKHQNTWLANRRREAKIETDLATLPPGVAATVDGRAIAFRTLVAEYLELSRSKARKAAGKAETEEARDVRRVVDMLAQAALVEALLAKHGLKLEDADLDAEAAHHKAEWEAKPQYRGLQFEEVFFQRSGITVEQWKKTRDFRLKAGIGKLGQALATRDEVQAWYEKNLSRFGPRYTVKHLLIRGSDAPKPADAAGRSVQPLAKARKQMEAVSAELAAGKRFEDLVALYSEDTATKLNGGGLEPFTPGERRLPAEFVALAERLEPGQVGGPVESPAGVHLVKLEKKEPPPPVEEVDGVVRRELGMERFRAAWLAARRGVAVRLD
ncbi:MAG TPA: peptidylprolyl isomerase, partial [Planctomycetota bacterium]|nr:peptidylprolyl isomerase [Planctomycetota bacterium]